MSDKVTIDLSAGDVGDRVSVEDWAGRLAVVAHDAKGQRVGVALVVLTPDEWDRLVAAGNRALGREPPKVRRRIVSADGDDVSERLSRALGTYGITWGAYSLTSIDGGRRDAIEVQLRVATVGIFPGPDGWEIES